MENSVLHRILLESSLTTAHAIAVPSKVAVPRPDNKKEKPLVYHGISTLHSVLLYSDEGLTSQTSVQLFHPFLFYTVFNFPFHLVLIAVCSLPSSSSRTSEFLVA